MKTCAGFPNLNLRLANRSIFPKYMENDLEYGMRDPEMFFLQRMLIEERLLLADFEPTGSYWDLTKADVLAF